MELAFPFVYLVRSRLKTKQELLSWLLIYVLPVFILGYSFYDQNWLIKTIQLLGALIVFFTYYEIGYIINDFYTTKIEKSPNKRFTEMEFQVISTKIPFILLGKILLVVVLLLALKKLAGFGGEHFLKFLTVLLFTTIFFTLHNFIRNRINIMTYLGLSIVKYSFLIFVFGNNNNLNLLWPVFFLFPFLRTLEHASKKKYGIQFLSLVNRNLDVTRVIYYSLLSVIFGVSGVSTVFLGLSLYYLAMRFIILLLLSKRSLKAKFRAGEY